MRRALPIAVAVGNALFWFYPSRDSLIGSGADPNICLWSFESVWKKLDLLGLHAIYTDAFWKAPIYHPTPLTMALSENFLYAGILTWPLKHLLGSGVVTLNLFAMMMSLAAFLFASLWLESLGAKRLAWWGGLIFMLCGWLQSSIGHYQNLCIFFFPLGLWLFQRYLQAPSWKRLVPGAIAFGLIGGFNMYFQVFGNLALGGMILASLGSNWRDRHRPEFLAKAASLLAFAFAALLLELPIAVKYIKFQAITGSLGVGDQEYMGFSASLGSFLGYADTMPLLKRIVHFYPAFELQHEGAGFLGITWVVLMGLSLRERKLRPWIFGALAAYWIALGPHAGLMPLFRLFPGASALRAIGRIQILTLLLSLPAVVLYLERQKNIRALALPLALVFLELLPAHASAHIPISPEIDSALFTPFSRKLVELGAAEPLIVIPGVDARFQLALSQTMTPTFGGMSGRDLGNSVLLQKLLNNTPLDSEKLERIYQYRPFQRIVSLEASGTAELRKIPSLRFEGCFDHAGQEACLFDWIAGSPRGAPHRLYPDQDFAFAEASGARGQHTEMRALHDGVLDYDSLSRCWLREEIRFPHLPAVHTDRPIPVAMFPGVEFHAGEKIAEFDALQAIYRLPRAFRATKSHRIACSR